MASTKYATGHDYASIVGNLLNYTTNRILEIPQNIKYSTEYFENDNGKYYRLKILKGSTYCVPNGFEADGVTPKFLMSSTSTDNFVPDAFWSVQAPSVEMVFIYFKDTAIFNSQARIGSNVTSGDTAPTSFLSNCALWYDTKTNYVKFTNDSGVNWYNASFPLLIGQPTTYDTTGARVGGWVNGVTQVFNGIGFIGSTVFALPDVKCQFANGKNEDGSYKTYNLTTTKVLTKTFGPETYNTFDCSLASENGEITGFAWHINEDFDPESGYIKINHTSTIQENICPVFRFFIKSAADNGRISQFIPNEVGKLNWKRSELSMMGMPSRNHVALAQGATGTYYAAPGNGWFYFAVQGPTTYFYLKNETLFQDNGTEIAQCANLAGGYYRAYLPVRAGDFAAIYYDGSITNWANCKFIYAEGAR